MTDKIEKLKALYELANDSLTRKESLEFSKNVVAFIKRIEKQNLKDITAIKTTIDLVKRQIKEDSSLTTTEVKKITKEEMGKMSGNFKSLSDKINDAILEIKPGEDGKDADEEFIIERVKEQIVIPEIQDLAQSIPQLGEPIKDALELLQDDDRLDVSAIKGLKRLIEELTPRRMGGGGGLSKLALESKFVDDETPSGLVNSTNKVFTIVKAPNPVASLKVYKDGQRMKLTEDYTFSGIAITFVDAPLTDSILTCDYRT